MQAKALILAVMAATLTMSGCASASPPTPVIIYVTPEPTIREIPTREPTVPPTPKPAPTPTPTPTPATASRSNPVPLGQPYAVGDWLVAVSAVNSDAWGVIKAENQFNTAPAAGNNYVMVTYSLTYKGAGKGTVWLDLRAGMVGSSNVAYNDPSEVLPSGCTSVGDVFPGGSVTCNDGPWQVPTGEIGSTVLYMSAGFSREEIWFALR